jgi:hypothetical protein
MDKMGIVSDEIGDLKLQQCVTTATAMIGRACSTEKGLEMECLGSVTHMLSQEEQPNVAVELKHFD